MRWSNSKRTEQSVRIGDNFVTYENLCTVGDQIRKPVLFWVFRQKVSQIQVFSRISHCDFELRYEPQKKKHPDEKIVLFLSGHALCKKCNFYDPTWSQHGVGDFFDKMNISPEWMKFLNDRNQQRKQHIRSIIEMNTKSLLKLRLTI